MKRLFLDIETSLSTVGTFALKTNFINPKHVINDWQLICAAWKWEGDETIYSKATYTKNDRAVVAALRKAIIESDEIVYHNGRKFDYKKLNTRVILNGLPPMTKPLEIDTMLQCKKHFGFLSNSLNFIAKSLLGKEKLKTSEDLWMGHLAGRRECVDELREYNKVDVVILEEVYQVLAPYIDTAYNHNVIKGGAHDMKCPKCGSIELIRRGERKYRAGIFARFSCNKCGAWCHGGPNLFKKRLTGKTIS